MTATDALVGIALAFFIAFFSVQVAGCKRTNHGADNVGGKYDHHHEINEVVYELERRIEQLEQGACLVHVPAGLGGKRW